MISHILKGISTGTYKSILCLDGNLGNLKDVHDAFGLPLVVADGAANRIVAFGLDPYLVIGDLDSVDSEILLRFDHLKLDNQDTSDFQKAVSYMKENALLPSIILGISGGNIDHIINNVNIFLSCNDSIFIDEDVVGIKISDTEKRLRLPVDTKLSIIGMPECRVTTFGLKWELKAADLAFAACPSTSSLFGYSSYFNRTVTENIMIEVTSGTALLVIYTREILDAGCKLHYAAK
ncbi:MAG: thiamine diphosphokinase [Holosporales bacterium]|jgi:thiamine pyrophosphokinase|nr:thiamine diphosphokinase [Holosporales bacterium]